MTTTFCPWSKEKAILHLASSSFVVVQRQQTRERKVWQAKKFQRCFCHPHRPPRSEGTTMAIISLWQRERNFSPDGHCPCLILTFFSFFVSSNDDSKVASSSYAWFMTSPYCFFPRIVDWSLFLEPPSLPLLPDQRVRSR